ncbi:MAG: single-stranded-DNA-specific exonuclease RecJ [Chitinophagaceae bacterium]
MERRWNILQADHDKVSALQTELKIDPVICKMLVSRGIFTFEEARLFFRPDLSMLHSPWLMKDMNKGVDRILQAINRNEKILVFGDYDVDGTTSVALMYQFLEKIYNSAYLDFYVPHRYTEGYGISKKGIDQAYHNDFTLIISLDCGIKSLELVSYAKTLGIDFIICDHHMPGTELPDAVAILNPKQEDCAYPYKDLCGCGVGFKLVTALAERLELSKQDVEGYLDLVAVAIAADIVSITGENRVMAYYGLKKINENPCMGIKALIHLSGFQKKIHITNVVFIIAPRVNAAGRMDDATKAVRMFIEKDFDRALVFAHMLHSDNTDRKEADSIITEEALALIELDHSLSTRKSTVVFKPHWHKGVVGIVASRLIEKYYRPTIVLTKSGELIAGSARSVQGFNLYEAIHACREHLVGYGGHFAAAGMTLLPDQVEAFITKFEEVVSSTILPELLVRQTTIEAVVKFKDLTTSLYRIICQMEPFGPGNMRPVLVARKVVDSGFSKMLKEQHIKFSLLQDDVIFNGIGFNMAEKFFMLQAKMPLDIVFTLDENEWNNQKQLQLTIIDFRISAP